MGSHPRRKKGGAVACMGEKGGIKCLEQVLGTEELNSYLNKYRLELDPQLGALVGRHSRRPWARFINDDKKNVAVPEAIDFTNYSAMITRRD